MKVIEVEYNVLRNWPETIRVHFPQCEHDKVSVEEIGSGEKLKEVVMCAVCGKIAVSEDGDYFWVDLED